jgi:hypothetical protein
LDISISGCTVLEPTIALSPEQNVVIDIPIGHGDDLPASFRASARVVRVEHGLAAVQFLDLDEAQIAGLHKWFAYEIRQDALANT